MANNPTEVDLQNNENNVSISKMLEAPLGPFSAVDLTIGYDLYDLNSICYVKTAYC